MRAIGIFLLALLLGCGPALAFDPFAKAGVDRKEGARVPLDLAFRDETGQPMTLRQAAGGKPLLLAPVLHNCPHICGLTLAGLAEAIGIQKFVPGKDFEAVAFGIDPHEGPRDAANSLGRLKAAFPAMASGIHGFTGSAKNIRAVTDALGYRYAWDQSIGQYAHIAAVAVVTPDGRLSHWLYGITPDPTDVRLALTEAGQGKIGSWGDQLLLLCYHYDPQTGRYGSTIWLMLRIVGGATAALGAGAIGIALLRERRKARRVSQ
jgi:protein SCO1/2